MVATLPTKNDTALKDFIMCKLFFFRIERKQAFWIVAPGGWVIALWCFEGTYRLEL